MAPSSNRLQGSIDAFRIDCLSRWCSVIFIIVGLAHRPSGIGVVAAAAGVPEDAIERVFVGLVDLVQRQRQRDLGPVPLAGMSSIADNCGFSRSKRDDVLHRPVGRKVGRGR